MSLWQLFLLGLGVLLGSFTLVWLWSLLRRDASVVDIVWGPAFALAAWTYRFWGPEPVEARQLLLLTLVTLWGARLGLYIAWRARGKGEDYRYTEMRENHGPAFRWKSLFIVFWLQAGLAAVIGLPHLFVQGQAVAPGLTWLDGLGLALWIGGFLFEAVADYQMLRFKSDPGNKGKVLDRGLWAWSRHPNYFGDFLVWWGFFAIALGAPNGWWTLPGPLLMSFLLLKVSGVALLEKTIAERRPAYRDYVERTSAFFPRPPKRSGSGTR